MYLYGVEGIVLRDVAGDPYSLLYTRSSSSSPTKTRDSRYGVSNENTRLLGLVCFQVMLVRDPSAEGEGGNFPDCRGP